jgi:hypothetical protein
MAHHDFVQELKRLSALRASGDLTEDEFAQVKDLLLRVPLGRTQAREHGGSQDLELRGAQAPGADEAHEPQFDTAATHQPDHASNRPAMGTTPMTTTTPARTRACAYCGNEMARGYGASCPRCGWRMGLIPVGESQDSTGNVATQFIAEQPFKYGRFTLLLLVFGGLLFFLVGLGSIGQNGAQGLAVATIGLAPLALGIQLWKETRFAHVTYGLTPGMKALACTVFTLGRVVAYCTVVGVFIGLFADKWIRNQI